MSLARCGALALGAFVLALVALDPTPTLAGGPRHPKAQDDDPPPAGGGGEDGATPAPDATPPGAVDDDALSARVEAILRQRPCRTTGGVVTVEYPLSDGVEADDFRFDGWDKVEIRQVAGQRVSGVGLELGSGSRGRGRMAHKLLLSDDFEIEADLWIPMNTPSAVVCFVLNDKVGALWGQQLVKPGSGMRPWSSTNPAADPTQFKEEREAKVLIKATHGLELTVDFCGRRAGQHRFTKGELHQVRFGLVASNVRLVITNLRITGKLDPAHLE